MEGYSTYIFMGVGVAISVLGFFLKREAQKTTACERRITELEVTVTKNEALDQERWSTTNKLLEDRREDVRNLYAKFENL